MANIQHVNIGTIPHGIDASALQGKTLAEVIADAVKVVSDAYSSSATYKVGDLCIYNNALYKCNTAISTAEAWTAAHWTATTIGDEIGNTVLWYPSTTVSATTGNIVSLSNAAITPDHVLASLEFANNAAITALNGWSTQTAGTLTISGTCTSATTVDLLLVKKRN